MRDYKMDQIFFIELLLSGKVLVHPEENGKNLCFLLSENNYLLKDVEKTLGREITDKAMSFDQMMHLKQVAKDTVYLFINSTQLEDKIELEVSYPLRGFTFKVKKTGETLNDYLMNNYLGQTVFMTYYQANSLEYLEKFLFDNKLPQSQSDINNSNKPRKAIKL